MVGEVHNGIYTDKTNIDVLNVDANSDDSEDESYNYDSALEVVFDNSDESEVYTGESLFHVDHCGASLFSILKKKTLTLSSRFNNFFNRDMSYSTSLESLGDSQSPPKDGEECLNVLNPIIDLNANTNEEPLTNESTPANEVVNEENVESSDIVIQKSKRKKTSLVWDHFKKVELKNGKKWQCIHCKNNYSVVASGLTSHLMRHLKQTCHVYKKLVAQQKKLNFQPAKSKIDEKLSGPLLMNSGGKYDHERQREATAHWIMMHEHAFSIVEEEGFHFMMKCSNISYEKISRKTLKNDCIAVYEAERKKLKSTLRTKRILSFVHVPPPRRGVDITDAIFKCLKDWGIENKIFSVSVDNAHYNDRCLKELKVLILRHRKLVLDGKLFHVRCCAHILNLLVQDGIGKIAKIVEDVRESVKFINQSEARLQTFSQIVQQLKLGGKKLNLDCPTHWNSTYQMLSVAMQFKEVFPRFQDREPSYTTLPDDDDWEKVEKVSKLLEVFNVVTNIISGSEYPTANLYLAEVFRIKLVLDQAIQDESDFMKEMAKAMKGKFDKYWSQCNLC
ncbi:zinc finger BED domain-containing protein RICESLEEPER 2 [Lathyrus oleraceus]|uniref:zinc finger BED domain-containing protein RICESLEEPER 2 n=1 Tax=Pisum sativum TaxID=3888 RepID=UPI0021CE9133|nr:zinc finger BED domain-containing protein RICESLEEPER 2-like [Pisum sativum]